MSFAQFHYTSAAPGPDGSGFRFTAVTPGVPQALLREVEQVIGYEPPRDAPPRPTASELDVFPRAFSHTLLSDGSRLLSRTVYTGSDYSGRWGNFHAHAVHLPAGTRLPADVLPITAWDSPQWASATPDGGIPVPVDRFTPGEWTHGDRLPRFAVSRQSWLAAFFADLRALAQDPTAPHIVLVERDSADVARWIALASTALPRNHAHQLTFTTYTRRPQQTRQQIVGIPPDAEPGLTGGAYDHRYRVHDCTGRPPGTATPVSDVWAETCARIWLAGEPGIFKHAASLPAHDAGNDNGPDGGFDARRLAAAALQAGIALSAECRTAAVCWARDHVGTLPSADWAARLLSGACAPAENRTLAESTALAQLLEALHDHVTPQALAPLAALVLTLAVRNPRALLPAPSTLRGAVATAGLRGRLAADLASDIRAGITDGSSVLTRRRLDLLDVADLLGVDCSDLFPTLAKRLAHDVFTDPDAVFVDGVVTAIEGHRELRTLLLRELDVLAADNPPAAARMLRRSALPLDAATCVPHLAMCATHTPPGDRVSALHAVLDSCGTTPQANPLILRTGVALVWEDVTPSSADARLLLAELGPEPHRGAQTWPSFVEAALASAADDVYAPDLARELLHCFERELAAREHAALRILAFAGDLAAGRAEAPWVARVQALCPGAEPLETGIAERVFGTLAHELLTGGRHDEELHALARAGERRLTGAYLRAARSERVARRLRSHPAYVAECFVAWTSYPGAHQLWDETRTVLLDEVLRPAVRRITAEEVATVERCLGRRADDFRAWNRPGALGRFAQLLGGRTRRASQRGPMPGDVELPGRKDWSR